MIQNVKQQLRRRPSKPDATRNVRLHLALALIGQTVDLLVSASTIAHGVVSGVLTESDVPKVVVDGSPYELNQILTVTPTALN